MKVKCLITTLVSVLLDTINLIAQGFVNLDFENASLSGYTSGSVPSANAIPGWTAYIGGVATTNVNYNVAISGLSGVEIDILGTNSGYAAIQGDYFMYLQGSRSQSASIGQTGIIPLTAQTFTFYGSVFGSSVSFNGHPLSLNILGSTGNYSIYGADISAFPGQTGQLLFTSNQWPGAPGIFVDNIQFSSSPIPEPSSALLLLLGGGACIYALKRNHRSAHARPGR
jgi:hypothetical protein